MKHFVKDQARFVVGCNSKENWMILEEADDEDIWVHLHGHPSPYVIIKKDTDVLNDELEYAGRLCKSHSKLKHVKNTVKMSSLKVAYVRKGRQSGQAKLLKAPNVNTIRT